MVSNHYLISDISAYDKGCVNRLISDYVINTLYCFQKGNQIKSFNKLEAISY